MQAARENLQPMPKFVLIMAVLTVAAILLATFWDRLFK
jgi:hypothetical protein